MTEPATPSQIAFLRRLAAERAIYGPEVSQPETVARMEVEIAGNLTKVQASARLGQVSAAARRADSERPASNWDIRRVRELAAERALFGLTVTREETINRVEALINQQMTLETARDLRRRGSAAPPHPTAQTPLRLSDIEGIDGLAVSEGHYAVFDTEDTLRYYRIYTPSAGALSGVGVIRRFAGDNLHGLYPAEAQHALQVIDRAPDEAAFRFADTFTRCWVCGRTLTDAVSRLLSVGPTCRGFTEHSGLRVAAGEVDHDPGRRQVFRALRNWALGQGFLDPRSKDDRAAITMSASRVASAWSGIPGVLGLEPDRAVRSVAAALTGDEVPDTVLAGLMNAPADTLHLLIESQVLSAPVLQALLAHPDPGVTAAANDFFLRQLGS